MKNYATLLAALALITPSARAMIVYGVEDAVSTVGTNTDAPWSTVAKITDSLGNGITGSAVHLGNGYMITAAHVTLDNHVSFDGTTRYAIDTTFSPITLSAGADAKIFRLVEIPVGIDSAKLANGSVEHFWTNGGNKAAAAVVHIGWGLGATETLANPAVWGDTSGAVKRFGTNTLQTYSVITPDSQPGYAFVTTHAGQFAGESSATRYDSGSGLFQRIDNAWTLVGIATGVTTRNGADTTTFGGESTAFAAGDETTYLRVGAYTTEITGIIAIPEPAHYALAAGALLPALALVRSRQRTAASKRRSAS